MATRKTAHLPKPLRIHSAMSLQGVLEHCSDPVENAKLSRNRMETIFALIVSKASPQELEIIGGVIADVKARSAAKEAA